jgi:HEAT repeat protein
VVYAQQLTRPDNEVEQALVQAARQDPNVNVRLAAVDGLSRYGSDPAVRRTLADGLLREESPLVEVALIEFLVNAHARDCALEIKQLAASPDAEPIVRQRAEWGLKQLGLSEKEIAK